MTYSYQRLRFFSEGESQTILGLDLATAFWLAMAAVLALAILGMMVRNYRRRKAFGTNWLSPLMLKNPADVDYVLQEALQQQCVIMLTLVQGVMRRRPLSCALLDLRSESLVIESVDEIGAVDRLVGREVSALFKTDSRHLGPDFYSFESIVTRASLNAKGKPVIEVRRPETLLVSQRRNFLRLSPSPLLIESLTAWRLDGIDRQVHSAEQLGSPWMAIKQGTKGGIRLVDISGGGIRLAVRETKLGPMHVRLGARFAIKLELVDPKCENPLRLWVVAEVKNCTTDNPGGEMHMGLQFHAFACSERNGALRWRPLGEDGVPSLVSWVIQRHMDIYREKGITG